MNVSQTTMLLGYGGMIMTVLGIVTAGFVTVTDPTSALRRRWAEYVRTLDYEVRFLLLKTTGQRIALTQLAIVLAIPFVSLLLDDSILVLLIPIVAVGPYFWLRRQHDERVRLLEENLDSWLLMLANALKASPSLGEAIQSSAKLMRAPFSEELDLVIKEMKLGTPLDQAVLNMSTRIKSRIISSSLATVLVGRQTGGDLPNILEQSAATLREMARLEGVVRTKTAEGKMQAIVLAAIPFVLLFAIHQVDNNWLRPLFETTIGYIVLTVATLLWAAAIFLARRILAVDI
ncbi:type II secretion system F family protein [Sandaracinus amylolyticus]|uniref:Flp pilus assembly protein TadB n=1 Tax=Sandaracinus amylolyticus TaxID=927083 RepID=A0A0F6YN01_9BACT|nr:type II secretion system F family protein [Sandaracinus amylolyticus]AKF11663.1 Flp pilus assembly protein TadB [Sandaracinus amylolyticus]